MIGGGHGSYLALEKANLFHACSETELLGPAATFWPNNSTPTGGICLRIRRRGSLGSLHSQLTMLILWGWGPWDTPTLASGCSLGSLAFKGCFTLDRNSRHDSKKTLLQFWFAEMVFENNVLHVNIWTLLAPQGQCSGKWVWGGGGEWKEPLATTEVTS